MDWPPAPGSLVETRVFGPARVIKVTRIGALVALLDCGGLEIEQPYDQLIAPSSTQEQQGRPDEGIGPIVHEPVEQEIRQPGTRQARTAIDALRFGLVPAERIRELTLGFDNLERWILARLPNPRDPRVLVSEICGVFGTGKSHAMAVIRYVAQRENYLTARVEIDGKRLSLSNPARLLSHLWPTLGGKNLQSATPVLDMYLKAIDRGCPAPSVAPRGVDRVGDNYRSVHLLRRTNNLDKYGYAMDAVLSSSDEFRAGGVARQVYGEPNVSPFDVSIRPMIGTKVTERAYDFVKVLLGHAIVSQLAGYSGLAITIDEFEIEDLLTGHEKRRIIELLEVLVMSLQGQLDHPPAPLALFFATVGAAGHVGDDMLDKLTRLTGGERHELRTWPAEDRRELARRIHRLYCEAYDLDALFDSELVNRIEAELGRHDLDNSGLIRAFIRRYVASLDSRYGPSADDGQRRA